MTSGAKPQPCCMPAAPGGQHSEVPAFRPRTATRPVHGEMVALPGGEFLMGSDATEGFPADGEGPARRVRIVPFRIAAHAVSNAKFATFVAEIGYRTEAEALGWSYVFSGFPSAALKLRRSTTTAAIASAFAVTMPADPNAGIAHAAEPVWYHASVEDESVVTHLDNGAGPDRAAGSSPIVLR